jgi:hypothetical protein
MPNSRITAASPGTMPTTQGSPRKVRGSTEVMMGAVPPLRSSGRDSEGDRVPRRVKYQSVFGRMFRDLGDAIYGRTPMPVVLWDPLDWQHASWWQIPRRVGYHRLAWRQACSEGDRFALLWGYLAKRKVCTRPGGEARFREISEEYLAFVASEASANPRNAFISNLVALVLLVALLSAVPTIGLRSFLLGPLSLLGADLFGVAIQMITPSRGIPRWFVRTLTSSFIGVGLIAWLAMYRGILVDTRVIWSGCLLVGIATGAATSQVLASAGRLRAERWMDAHLDAFMMGALEAIFHHTELHRKSWPGADGSREVMTLLLDTAKEIEARLPTFLNAPKSEVIKSSAREIAATFRMRAENLHTKRGREDVVRLVIDSAALIATDQVLEIPRSKIPGSASLKASSPRFTIRSAIAATLPPLAIYGVKYAGVASGIYVDALLSLAILWAVVRIMMWIDPDFSSSLNAVASVRSLLSANQAAAHTEAPTAEHEAELAGR